MQEEEEKTVVVELDDDEVEQQPKPEELIAKSVEEHEKDLEAERQAKKEAQERATRAEREAAEAKEQVKLSTADQVTAAITIAETQKNEAKRSLKEAMEKGDFDATIEAQEKLSEVTVALTKLKDIKVAVERAPRNEAPSDPVERYISQFTPRSQDYLRQNKEFVTDSSKNKLLVAAHYKAEASGLKPDTDEYFSFIDKEIKPVTQPVNNNKTTPAAPVSRGGSQMSGGSSKREVKLSPRQATAATDGTIVWNHGPNKGKPIGVKEYARRLESMRDDDSDAMAG